MKQLLPLMGLMVLSAAPAHPWGGEGHAAVGLVAEQRLKPETQRHVEAILGNTDLASIASWMDDVRGATHGYGKLAGDPTARELARRFPKNDEWHYVNLPLGDKAYTDNDPFARPDDVVHEINIAIAVLEGHSHAVSPRVAVYMIVHLVGDLHQPLHATSGYYDLAVPSSPMLLTDPARALGKPSDKGGNSLTYGSQRYEELHGYWDTGLPQKLAHSREPAALAKIMMNAIKPAEWKSPGDYHQWAEGWATDSLAAARQVYAGIQFGTADVVGHDLKHIKIRLPQGYDEASLPVVRDQLAKAGFHLAELLNAIHWSN